MPGTTPRHLLHALAALALAVPAPGNAARPGPVAAIDSGSIQGAVEDDVAVWRGIPFAAPPVGALRWRAPQLVAAWSGVRQATGYASDCMQLPFPSDAAPLGTAPAEDCLYANVWKPVKAGARLPVIVWIYGGGFVNGGSSPPTYAGARLARQGVVLVSFNYRLGRFGFFGHGALTREAAEGHLDGGLSVNYGYMDQLAALQWVQRNAQAFGGDAANVTIIGESAGGMSVNMLLTSPMARGLFAKAVVLSGGDGGVPDPGMEYMEQVGANFALEKGIAKDDPQALDKLRALPAAEVVDGLNLANRPGPDEAPTYIGPIVDGRLALDARRAFAEGAFAKVPVMIGATSADIGGRTGYMVAGARSLGSQLAERGVPVYAYRFSYVAESLGQDGATAGAQHASDIPFFFDTVGIKYGEQSTRRDLGMGRAMSAYLVNFAKRGDPNGGKLPAWPRYRRTRDEIMDFAPDGKPRPGRDPWGINARPTPR